MEESRETNAGDFSILTDETQTSSVFRQLKPYCLDLLDFLQNPNKKNPRTLSEMAEFLRRAPATGLQPCLDYTLFPLLLLLDAAVLCRSKQKAVSEGIGIDNDIHMPHMISDRVAEGALQCLEEVLMKCHLGSVNQMIVVLKKLTSGALLCPSEAAEEFREGIIRCLRALLLGLNPCSVDSCICKQIPGLPTLLSSSTLETQLIAPLKSYSESDECLLAFLQSQNASPAVGHWLSLLLQIAEAEATRGHRGSAKLRIEAFLTLRVLVAKVGTAEALAFFLPGVVSHFAKVLHVTKTMITGAAGSAESIDSAIRGFAEFLMIVLEDEANLYGLDMSTDDMTGFHLNKDKSTQAVLEALRHLPVNAQVQVERLAGNQPITLVSPKSNLEAKGTAPHHDTRSLYANRTKDWIEETSSRVDKLLCATFPHLCVHPSQKVREGLVDGIHGLLSKCTYTLKNSKLMLLECLCILVCDDSDAVSVAAQKFLESFFVFGEKHLTKHEVDEIFNRLVEKLPRVVLGSEEAIAVSHAQRLLAVMYYAGPQLVVDHLLCSPITAARFLDVLMLSFSHNSVFAGSADKLLLAMPHSVGYLHSVRELKAGLHSHDNQTVYDATPPLASRTGFPGRDLQNRTDLVSGYYELPRMPPWFVHAGGQKLYQALAGILRFVGLSIVADHRSEVSLSVLIDIPLDYFRNLISELRMREHSKESWHSWYARSGSGQLLRQASTAVCVLNEIIYGMSDESVDVYTKMFQKSRKKVKVVTRNDQPDELVNTICNESVWKFCQRKGVRNHVIEFVGSILHEYLSQEVWDLPTDQKLHLRAQDPENEELPLHFFRDATMLHQVIIDGIGIFNISLGKDFLGSGFLHASLYLLLETLICSSYQKRSASDVVLHVLSASSGHPTMRAVSLELEVLGRHQHPDLTIPFLKAVREIAEASGREACAMPSEIESFSAHVKSKIVEMEKEGKNHGKSVPHDEHLEEMLSKLNESRRYRRTVGSIAGSCLTAVTPLLASVNEAPCLVALDIIEDGLATLAKVEEAYRLEKEIEEAIGRAIQFLSFHDIQDSMEAADGGADENRLLPAMNKIWPYLVHCLKDKNLLATRRCLSVVSSVVQICGGDFFTRRFHTDGAHFWKLLSTSPFRRKPMSKEERLILLPYRSTGSTSTESMAEVSSMKVQEAALNMIADISRNKRSASAFEAVLKKVSGLAVGIACSSIAGLREASMNALLGLASVDPDLIWLLLADIYYSLKKDIPSPPTVDFSDVAWLLPPPLSSKEYLYMQYGGDNFGFDVDASSVEIVFQKLQSEL
ncbi:uncharacterized protein LOC131250207 isoform X2 [Magnolia sinica]|uniref:uncharacterized protein LOC131250207 isoform X2 n=1 Tax=Magnolia sinica TaxID=86752 RepID=UPI00265AE84F|nr:uncharacterized protein LOC131250207 isoform X2 [Magnolia sinica]